MMLHCLECILANMVGGRSDAEHKCKKERENPSRIS